MKHMLKTMNHFLAEMSGWLVMVLMILLITDFVGRAFSKPIQGLGTLSVYTLVAAVYFGIPHCEEDYGHVRVEILINKFPKKIAKYLNIFAYTLAVIIILICFWSIGINTISSFISQEKEPGTFPIVLYPAKFTVAVGMFFYLLQLISNLIDQYKIKLLK